MDIMPESSEHQANELPLEDPNTNKLADAVRLTLLQAAQMQQLTQRVQEIKERISKLTPPPKPAEANE
jgi:hypothetical protein